MYPSVILSTWTFLQVVLHSATSHAQIVPPSHFYYNTTSAFASPRRNVISQQDLSLAPPMPILDIGLQHMLGQMGANATRAENVSIAEAKGQPPPEVSKFTLAHQKDAPAECGPGQPCADASCCNSVRAPKPRNRIRLMKNRKASADLNLTIVSLLLQRPVSRTAMLMLCVEWIRCGGSRNAN